MNLDEFKNKVHITRYSRIRAEKRLLRKQRLVELMNLYYSLFSIIISIISYIQKDEKLSLAMIFLTICLFSTILYINTQNYIEKALQYRENYTRIYEIELRLLHISDPEDLRLEDIEKKYCTLLRESANHTDYDLYCVIHDRDNDEYRKQKWKKIRNRYYWANTWRALVIVFFSLLPIIVLLITVNI